MAALLEQPEAARYGYDLMKSIRVASGTLYPILLRLEERGYLSAEWRKPVSEGRPPRHAYKLTSEGRRYAAHHIDAVKAQREPTAKKASI